MGPQVTRQCTSCGEPFTQGKWWVLRKEKAGEPLTCSSCSIRKAAQTRWAGSQNSTGKHRPYLREEDAKRVELRQPAASRRNRKPVRVYVFDCLGGCSREVQVPAGRFRTVKGYCLSCARRTRPFQHTFGTLKAGARHKGIPVTLTYEELLGFTETTECHYCGEGIPWEPWSSKVKQSKAYFLDRKDPPLGYTADNCVVCCTNCNYVRSNRFTYEEFLLLAPGLREVRRLRKGKNATEFD